MLSLKPVLFLLLTLVCLGVSKVTPHQKQQLSTAVVYGGHGVFPVRIETGSNGEEDSSSMILAEKRTRRKDPANHLKYYDGGWNISDHHYKSSVLYTAAPLFGIAAVWFVGFGLSLLSICFCYCCCRRTPYGYSRTAYALSLAFLALFTIAAIVGCVILYTGQGKFHNSTTDTLDFVVSESKDTINELNNVSEILATSKNIGVDQVSLPPSMKQNIDRVDEMVSKAVRSLDSETQKNEKDIHDVLNSVRLALIIVAAIMLLVALLGFLLSIFGLQVLVYILVVLGWILVTVTFILCGIFLTLHNVMGDTCVAMDEWVQHPTAHTALDDILPCIDHATAQETLFQTKDVTFQLVDTVNKIIINVANIDPPPFPGLLNYNQSGPLVPTLCNPLNANKTDRKCQDGELDASNAAQIWKAYVCQVSANDMCTTVGRLTPKMYDQMSAAANVSSGLTYYGAFLAGLMDCSFVRFTFTRVHADHCPELIKYSKWVYIGLTMVSVAVMLSLVLWVLYARERRHRKYTKLAVASEHASLATEAELK
ncbi:putative transmembrane protein [Helianthus debilis subsp. tardiflorus]